MSYFINDGSLFRSKWGSWLIGTHSVSLNRSLFISVAADVPSDPLETPEKRLAAINVCVAQKINVIYLDMFQYLGSTNSTATHISRIQSFIAACSVLNIAVWAFSGAMDWSKSALQGWVAANITGHITDYNSSSTSDQRFSGFMLDVEYWLDGTQTATNGLAGLNGLINTMRTSLGLPVGAFAAPFLMDNSRLNITYNGNSKQEGAHLMDVASAIVVGSYRRYALPFSNQSGQIQLMQPWIDYAATGVANLYCGYETNDLGDPNVSYFQSTYSDLYTQEAIINTQFAATQKFKGSAIHDYAGFGALYPDAAYITGAGSSIPRAMYTWAETEALDPGQDPLVSPAKRAAVAQWCNDRGVTVAFLDIRNYVQLPAATSAKLVKMRDMVARLNAVGCKTYAMSYDLAWLDGTKMAYVQTNILDQIAAYNTGSATNEKFVGVHYDEEYWILAGVAVATNFQSLTSIKQIVLATKATTGLTTGMFIASYLKDNLGTGGDPAITFNGKSAQQGEHVMDFCDYVVPAAYENAAARQIPEIQAWCDYSDTIGTCKVWGASETISITPAQTYYGSSRPQMETEFAQIMSHFTTSSSWKGIAVDSYDGWQALYPTPPAVVFDPTTPLSPNVGDIAGGGFPILATGTGFVNGMTVTLGGSAVVSLNVISSTQFTFIPPAHALGAANLVVILPADSTDSSRGAGTALYEYWSPAQIPSLDTFLDAGKGVTTSSNNVTAWLDQSTNALNFTQATTGLQPVLTSSTFGTIPSIQYAQGQYLKLSSVRTLAAGLSYFWVSKQTSADTITSDGYDVPLTVIGNSTATTVNGAGFSGPKIAYQQFFAGVNHTYTKVVTPILNNGSAWLCGWAHTTSGVGNLKPYVGMNQGDSSQAGVITYNTTNNGYDTIGAGKTPANGYAGNLGAVIITSGAISFFNRQKLHKWATQRFGVSTFNMS
jgi:hypothetical protein